MISKIKYSLLFLVLTLLCFPGMAQISISSNFEHGNILLKERIGDSLLVVETQHSLKWDSIGDQYYWFYFKLDNLPQKSLYIRFENLQGVYRGKPHVMYKNKPQLVFSYDQNNWQRMNEGEYNEENSSYLVSHKFDHGPVWLAWAQPYTYTQAINYMSKIASSPHVTLEKVSESAHGRGIFLYNISRNGTQPISKETVVAIAMQHPGEDAGAYFIEGFTDYLLDTPNSMKLLDKFNFLVIHVMNPDGIMEGYTRYNANMADLNDIWNKPDLMQPEVQGVQDWLNDYIARGHRITRFFDVHCWGQESEHLYLTNNDADFCEKVNKFMHFAVFPSTSEGGASFYFAETFGAKSATVELSQKTNNGPGLLTTDDYRKAGAAMLKALIETR